MLTADIVSAVLREPQKWTDFLPFKERTQEEFEAGMDEDAMRSIAEGFARGGGLED